MPDLIRMVAPGRAFSTAIFTEEYSQVAQTSTVWAAIPFAKNSSEISIANDRYFIITEQNYNGEGFNSMTDDRFWKFLNLKKMAPKQDRKQKRTPQKILTHPFEINRKNEDKLYQLVLKNPNNCCQL